MRPNQAAHLLSALLLILITACGGTLSAPRIPVFTSTAGTDAAEGATYSYQITTAAGTDILALTNAPAGATLRGNTLEWVPAAAQSRTANSFTVTATTPAGRSATQSWTVVPRGTIRISWINNFWNENGSTHLSMDWSRIGPLIAVLVPQADGSFQSLSGAPGADGDFEIPNVPAGYFWLRLGPKDTYWTSSSTFDAGADVFASSLSTGSANTTTRVNFSFTGLEPTSLNGWLQFLTPDSLALNFSGTTAAGSDTFTSGILMNGNVDLSAVRNAFVMQYKPTTLGYLPGAVLGPELSLTNLSLTTGAVNTISGALHPSVPAVLSLSVAASAWAAMFDHVAPAPPNATGGSIAVWAEPYTDVNSPNSPWSSAPISLIRSMPVGGSGLFLTYSGCAGMSPATTGSNGFFTTTTLVPMNADVDAGTVQYSDPFPAAWQRVFNVCQNASVDVQVPGTNETQGFVLTNSQTTALPTQTVQPLISPVQAAKINGANLFAARTIANSLVTLSWNPPGIGAPFGYQVTLHTPVQLPGGSPAYSPIAILSTAKTSMVIPPDMLAPGHTYLFEISALVDGRANMETRPHRSSLPVAQADLLSAPITIGTTP